LRFDKLFANFRRVKKFHVGEKQIYCCLLQIVEQHAACINELNDNNRLLFMAEKVLLLHSLVEEFSVSLVLVLNTTEPSWLVLGRYIS
jgi:hypothetical protein